MATPWDRIADEAYKRWLFEAMEVVEFNALGPLERRALLTQFQQQQRQQHQERSIFSHGLPALGPLSETTNFTSNPSIPTEEEHAGATIKILPFSTLSDLEELPYPKTNIWNLVIGEGDTGTLGGYSNEAGVNSQVERVIIDILEALGVREEIIIRAEVEIMRNHPDFMLILVNGHPVGTIEGKQPGEAAMVHPNILGEVYDQLMHLHSIFRVNSPFAILTTYNEWRICWLDCAESNELAKRAKLPQPVVYSTPVKQNQDLSVALEDMHLTSKQDSPPLPTTPSRGKLSINLQSLDDWQPEDEDLGNDIGPRTFCGTPVMQWNNKGLPLVLASVIKKMILVRQKGTPTVLRFANATTSVWKRAPNLDSLRFDLCISCAVKKFFLWEDLGTGADGRAFLVSGGTKNAVGVLKFFFTDADGKAEHEMRMWKNVYSHLAPVEKTVRVLKVMNQTALLMPWFQSPVQNQSELAAVEATLRNDYLEKGICHNDVAWRNVGVYCENGQTKAVVFDMQKVHHVKGDQQESWVTAAMQSLSQKLNNE